MSFSNKIKEIRRMLKLNQTELADKLGVSRSIVSEFENDSREPSKEFIIALSKIGISVDWFLTGEGSPFTKNDGDNAQGRMFAYDWENNPHQQANNHTTVIGDNNTQIVGDKNKITASTRQHTEYDELFCLIRDYATPKMLKDLKEKLLKIKETVNE